MANKIFDDLLLQQFEEFKLSYSQTSKQLFSDSNTGRLRHPGEFGTYREEICRKLLRNLIPSRLEINTGFLINSNDETSTQCDIVVYDANVTPLVQPKNMQRFYPVESVCAVGEIKSTLRKTEFTEALHKLSRVKKLAEYTMDSDPSVIFRNLSGEYDPTRHSYDQIVTFLICQKLDFDFHNSGPLYSDEIEPRHRHNLILSVEDGVCLYALNSLRPEDGMWAYPTFGDTALQGAMYDKETSENDYFRIFAHHLFMTVSNVTILFPDIADYMVYPPNPVE